MPQSPSKPPQQPNRNLRPLSGEDLSLINRFRGLPRNPVRKTRPSADWASLIDRFARNLRVSNEASPEQTILANWEKVVGPNYAKRCTPARLQRDGTLVVLAPNPVLRQELGFQKRKILFRIRGLSGCAVVKTLLLRGG